MKEFLTITISVFVAIHFMQTAKYLLKFTLKLLYIFFRKLRYKGMYISWNNCWFGIWEKRKDFWLSEIKYKIINIEKIAEFFKA